ncbi:MAG: 50S ribosomal protein L25 [Bacteroidales bacterium]|nr:50S ribosomal protein L25 [Bacteroidales bacterium]
MKIVSMSGSLRENVGKKDAKALRREDKVPCVMYGKDEQKMFSVPQTAFHPVIFTPDACFIEIELNGTKHLTMLKDIQYHPVTEIVYHADFYELSDDKPVVMSIPVYTTGSSKGVMKGGKLVTKIKRLKVKALPKDMPNRIVLDVTDLDVLQGIKVQEVPTNNFELLDVKSSVVVTVKSTRSSATSTEETSEEAAAPAAE